MTLCHPSKNIKFDLLSVSSLHYTPDASRCRQVFLTTEVFITSSLELLQAPDTKAALIYFFFYLIWYLRVIFHLTTLTKKYLISHPGAKIRNSSKNSHFDNLTFLQNSPFQNLIFHKIHIFEASFPQNSHFQNVTFHKIHSFKI